MDLYQCLARSRLRHGPHIRQLQLLNAALPGNSYGFHGYTSTASKDASMLLRFSLTPPF
jgi:hypothetical protein